LLLELKEPATGEPLISLHAYALENAVPNLDVPIILVESSPLAELHVYSFDGVVPFDVLKLPGG
jgi:hypothetical protein